MGRAWIDEGLRHAMERQEARRLALDRRHHCQGLIGEQGPAMMQTLVDELEAAIFDYRHATLAQDGAIQFETLPRGGFLVSRDEPPRAILQCRPDYAAQTVTCNWAHAGEQENEMVEVPFNLHFTVDDSDTLGLRQGARAFHGVAEVAEFLLTPVLFPGLKEEKGESGR
jgi:hypothetical protein